MTLAHLSSQDEQLRRTLLDEAERRGHAVMSVEQDEQGAPYCFTVGAWRRFGVAEAVVVGLPQEMATVLLGAYVARASAGEAFAPGELHTDFFEGVAVTVERVAQAWYPEFFGSAFLLYSKANFPAVQLIVPTPDGHWPWSDTAPAGFAEWQQILTESGVPESWIPGQTGP
ncbi:MAG: DUF4262 domain-containing protein [Sciscionella sp.]